MKNLCACLLVSLIVASCGTSTESQKDTATQKQLVPALPESNANKEPLKKYRDVSAMMKGTNEYSEENGTFKIISQTPLHIQLSKPALEGDSDDEIKQEVKRNIVSVGFRTFAQTDIDELKITSIPMKVSMQNAKEFIYIQQYQQTLHLKREKAKAVLQKYYGHTDFTKLFGEQVTGIYMAELPTKEFKKMLFNDQGEPTLDKVFTQLSSN
jgi:hypothetical protein